MTSKERWFAIRTRPGTQRQAKPRIGEKNDRIGEFIIERNLRDAGFDVFMPSIYREIRHHRTEEYIVKRFPLMVGYSFVNDPRSFYALGETDGVSGILGVAGMPMRINTSSVQSIRDAEDRELELMERRRLARIQKEKQLSRKLTRKEARELFPKNHRVTVQGTGYLSGMSGFVVDATGRNTIKAVIETLNGLIPVELDIAELSEAV
jgi:transcription antitermination factor NusG